MKIKNWDKWQSYRSDRGAPPWIKVHRNLMSNPDWATLTDAEKGQLVSMWIMAADKGGALPDDPKIIRKICQIDEVPDINKFKDLGFIDAKVTPPRQPDDAPEEIRLDKKNLDQYEEASLTMKNTILKLFPSMAGSYAFEFEKWREYRQGKKPVLDLKLNLMDWMSRAAGKLPKETEGLKTVSKERQAEIAAREKELGLA